MFMVHVFHFFFFFFRNEKTRKQGLHSRAINQTFMNLNVILKKSSLSFIVISFKQKVQVGYCIGSSRVMMCTLEPCPDFIEDMIKKAHRTQ